MHNVVAATSKGKTLSPQGDGETKPPATRTSSSGCARQQSISTPPKSNVTKSDKSTGTLLSLGATVTPVPNEIFDMTGENSSQRSDEADGDFLDRIRLAAVVSDHETTNKTTHRSNDYSLQETSCDNECSAPNRASQIAVVPPASGESMSRPSTKAAEPAPLVTPAVINWAACDRCGKWRIIANALGEDAQFECTDAPGKNCTMPDDVQPGYLASVEQAAVKCSAKSSLLGALSQDQQSRQSDITAVTAPAKINPVLRPNATQKLKGLNCDVITMLQQQPPVANSQSSSSQIQDDSSHFEDSFVPKIQRMLDWADEQAMRQMGSRDIAASEGGDVGDNVGLPQEFLEIFAVQVGANASCVLFCGDNPISLVLLTCQLCRIDGACSTNHHAAVIDFRKPRHRVPFSWQSRFSGLSFQAQP